MAWPAPTVNDKSRGIHRCLAARPRNADRNTRAYLLLVHIRPCRRDCNRRSPAALGTGQNLKIPIATLLSSSFHHLLLRRRILHSFGRLLLAFRPISLVFFSHSPACSGGIRISQRYTRVRPSSCSFSPQYLDSYFRRIQLGQTIRKSLSPAWKTGPIDCSTLMTHRCVAAPSSASGCN